jgi:hypothetical protein
MVEYQHLCPIVNKNHIGVSVCFNAFCTYIHNNGDKERIVINNDSPTTCIAAQNSDIIAVGEYEMCIVS